MAWVKLNTAARNAALDAVVDLIDAGSGAGHRWVLEMEEAAP